jgi:peroxiredoxin
VRFRVASRSLLLSASLLAPALFTGCNRGDHPQQITEVAPDFTVHNESQTIKLDQFRGKVVLLNFWATWCAPCIEELPSLQRLQALRPDIQVLAISIDDDADSYKKFVSQNNMELLGARTGMGGVNLKYGTKMPPETFLIDRQGHIRRKFIGPQEWTNSEMMNYLDKM